MQINQGMIFDNVTKQMLTCKLYLLYLILYKMYFRSLPRVAQKQPCNTSSLNKKNGETWNHPIQMQEAPKTLNDINKKEIQSTRQSSTDGGRKSATPQRQLR